MSGVNLPGGDAVFVLDEKTPAKGDVHMARVTDGGKMVWSVRGIPFSKVRLDGGRLLATTTAGGNVEVDVETGKVLSRSQ